VTSNAWIWVTLATLKPAIRDSKKKRDLRICLPCIPCLDALNTLPIYLTHDRTLNSSLSADRMMWSYGLLLRARRRSNRNSQLHHGKITGNSTYDMRYSPASKPDRATENEIFWSLSNLPQTLIQPGSHDPRASPHFR